MDGDRDMDLVVIKGSDPGYYVNNGSGHFNMFRGTGRSAGSIRKVVDLDGNGTPDIIVKTNAGFKLITNQNGSLSLNTQWAIPLDNHQISLAADLNGNGLTDLVVTERSQGAPASCATEWP